MELPQVDNYRSILVSDTPLLDVRAPVEFQQGAFPLTTNVPLMNDEERKEIGIRYKTHGQEEAIKLGHQLVSGDVKQSRVDRWAEFFKTYPDGILYCFRGGMRSKITQQWIYEETGKIYPRINGGYKAMRRFLLDEFESSVKMVYPLILSGRTGIGKTLLLKKIHQQIDLEGIFHHRGSVFGRHVTPQPSQVDIENTLTIALMKQIDKGYKNIVLEDEGSNIGSRRIPQSLVDKIKQSPVIVLDEDIEERVNITFQEYITEALAEYQAYYNEEQGFIEWVSQLHNSLDRIKKRLGGVRHTELKILLDMAVQQHLSGNIEAHKEWIHSLLVDYYDPMYDYQLSRKKERVIFTGNKQEILGYLQHQYQLS